jgi:hypothetical protein
MELAPAAFLIAVTGGREADRGILAAWPDGVVVWSDDRVRGGPPYRLARIEPPEIARTAAHASQGGRWVGERRVGPDARWTHMTVHVGPESVIDIGSWHEIHELEPNLVVTATGIEPLGDRSRARVLARQPADYRAFRSRWDAVKAAALALIPTAGRPVEAADAPRMPWRRDGPDQREKP